MQELSQPRVLTDAQWAALAPLIAACRPPHKTEHTNLRRTIEAIIWRHRNGTPWRAIPPGLGPWWMAAQTFLRWRRHGVWEHLLTAAQERGGVGRSLAFLDGSSIRAHAKAAGARKRGAHRRRATNARRWGARAGAMAPRPA